MAFIDSIRKVQREFLDWLVGHLPRLGLEKRADGFTSIFQDFIPRGASVLDIGGGWGFYAEPLKRRLGCEVTVLDVVEPKFKKAPVLTYEGERIPFPDKTFEVSLLVTVLHHVPIPEKVLAEAKRVTRGFVIVVEDLYRHRLGRIWTILRDSFFTFEWFGHPRQFRTKDQWRRCFQALGFEIEAEKEVHTRLLGLSILNGIFLLRGQNG